MVDVPALNIRPVISDLAISVAELKSDYLFGIDLRNDDGDTPPDGFYERYIRGAMEWLQSELDIVLMPTDIVEEAHDYHFDDMNAYGYMKLFRRIVRSISRVQLSLPLSGSTLDIDNTWFKVESFSGQLSLVPGANSIQRFLTVAGSANFFGFYSASTHVPFSMLIDYKAGFASPSQIPPDLREMIALYSSLGPLNVFGDLVAGAGVASKSISIDGLSTSVGTTSSATNSGYGARIIQYDKQIKERMEQLRPKYRGIQMVIG